MDTRHADAGRLDTKTLYEIPAPPEHMLRLFNLLAPYDLVFELPNARFEIGRFSAPALVRIKMILITDDNDHGALLRVGSFCEFNDVVIMLAGNHLNESLFNFTFSSGKPLRPFLSEQDRTLSAAPLPEPIVIGDNVVVSAQALILSGADIGTGSVIGAGAVVANKLEPLGIYVGVPARRLRARFSDPTSAMLYERVRLPDVNVCHLPTLPTLLAKLQAGDLRLDDYFSQVTFLKRRPRIHIKTIIAGGRIAPQGVRTYFAGEQEIDAGAERQQLDAYCSQVWANTPTVQWTPDIFVYLGLS